MPVCFHRAFDMTRDADEGRLRSQFVSNTSLEEIP